MTKSRATLASSCVGNNKMERGQTSIYIAYDNCVSVIVKLACNLYVKWNHLIPLSV